MNAIGENLWDIQNVQGHGSRLIDRWPQSRNIVAFCLFETAFYFAYRYGMSFSDTCASPFWFPDTVLLCALLLSRPRNWWLFIFTPLPIRLLVAVPPNVPFWFLLTTFALDSVKGLAAAAALRTFVRNPLRLETVREFAMFCLFAVLLIPAASAFGGAAARHLLGYDYWAAWEQWFMGDALTHLVVTPAILYWVFGSPWKTQIPSIGRWVEGALVVAGLVLASYVAFGQESSWVRFSEPYFYAPVPFLFWAAVRFGMFGASGAISVIAILSVGAAFSGRGPFSAPSPTETALVLQHFLLLRAAPLYLVAILTDQKSGAERSLRESEERFRHMANTAPVLIWMSGVDKLCNFFNQGWLDFTGRTSEHEFGNGWAEGVHSEDKRHCLEVYTSSFEARQPFEMEFRLRRHDGEYRWILDKGVPRYAPNGDFVGYVGSVIDITDRKRAEEANRNLAHVQRLAVMGEFTAIIAHEVNQPLGAILSNAEAAEMLLEAEDPPLNEIREILADIRKNDLRADEVIRRIRALLRKREIQLAPLDLNETVSDVLRLVVGDALRRHTQIRREFSQSLPLAFGDRSYLQQVLLNLIFNGMDAMKEIPESARQLTVRTKSDGNGSIEVAVTDCGCGIAPDRLPRIFESFFTTKQEGMGLGLSIARSIIEAHKGRIWAENNSGEGTTFHFTLRAAQSVSEQRAATNE